MKLVREGRYALFVSQAVVLAACAVFTDASDTPRVTLVVQGTDNLGIVPASAAAGEEGIFVRGTLRTPCLGYGVTADARNTKSALVVTVRGKQQGEICLTAIGNFVYTGSVYGIASGARRVIVQHIIEDANWPVETVLDTTVVLR